MRTFKLKATIEITDTCYGDWVTTSEAAENIEKELLEAAKERDMDFVVTDIRPIEDADFIA